MRRPGFQNGKFEQASRFLLLYAVCDEFSATDWAKDALRAAWPQCEVLSRY